MPKKISSKNPKRKVSPRRNSPVQVPIRVPLTQPNPSDDNDGEDTETLSTTSNHDDDQQQEEEHLFDQGSGEEELAGPDEDDPIDEDLPQVVGTRRARTQQPLYRESMEHSIENGSTHMDNSGSETKRFKQDPNSKSGTPLLVSDPQANLKRLDHNSVIQFRDKWLMIAPDVRRCMTISQYIHSELYPIINTIAKTMIPDMDWKTLTDEELFNMLLKWLPRSNDQQPGQTAEERLLGLTLNFDGIKLAPIMTFLTAFIREFEAWDNEHRHLQPTEKERRTSKLISSITDKIKKKSPSDKSVQYELATCLELHGTFKTVSEFTEFMLNKGKECMLTVAQAMKMGMTSSTNKASGDNKTNTNKNKNVLRDNNKFDSKTNHNKNNHKGFSKGSSSNGNRPMNCTGCGRKNHNVGDCELHAHADFNKSANDWSESEQGKAWAAIKNKEGKPYLVLPRNITLDDMRNNRRPSFSSSSNNFDNNKGKKFHSKHYSLLAITNDKQLTEYYPNPYIRGEILSINGIALHPPLIAKVLLDTGALHANYMSLNVISEIENKYNIKVKINENSQLTLAANDTVINCRGRVTTQLELRNSSNLPYIIHNTSLNIINTTYDIIIGLPTIREHNLVTQYFSELFSAQLNDKRNSGTISSDDELYTDSNDENTVYTELDTETTLSEPITECPKVLDNIVKQQHFPLTNNITSNSSPLNIESAEHCPSDEYNYSTSKLRHQPSTLDAVNSNMLDPENNSQHRLMLIRSKESLLGIQKEEYIPHPMENGRPDITDFLGSSSEEEDCTHLISFQGHTDEFNNKLKTLCTKYSKVFRTKLNPTPAHIQPFTIDVDKDKWESNENRLPPRKQGPVKEKEILKQVNEMLKNRIIRESNATEYSQVLLTSKPGGEYRFCIDYRRLNDATKQIGWPLPNIKFMLNRLGDKKARFYGKMDMTKGYFQAPLAEASRKHTAFIIFSGIYEWLRVPMGTKGAPAYFQFMIATIVLAGLLYICCELYIDDVIVHGQDESDFLTNLEKVLARLQEKNVTLNPKKCCLGASEIEFVGHIVDHEGLRMSEEKRNKVINFAQPKVAKGLKSFLGLANYFRDHIKDHSKIVQPLQDMIKKYKKGNKLKWTEESLNAFNLIKQAINTCPKIFFLQEGAPICLHTDASKYAIGAYLFQIIDNKEYPIAFLSKTLQNSQLNWSTFEKEAYAIYYSFLELEYLLHDRFFTLRTDHANLTFIRDSGSEKVRRWKLQIQDYNFHIEHIEGQKNVVADAMTRLVDDPNDIDRVNVMEAQTNIPHNIYRMIGKCHNTRVGHHGVQRTLEKLHSMNFKVKHLPHFVKLFVKRCPACQKMSEIKPIIETIPFTTASTSPMTKINMDTIGPLPKTEEGYEHILVIIDCFSRWTECYPCKTTEAEEAAKHLVEFVGRFGCPKEIITDNGTQFVNKVIDHFVKLFGAQHLLSIPYSKQENAIVERINKEVMRHLRHIIFEENIIEHWNDSIPFLQRIINASIHSSTGYSPAQIIYGERINLERNIITPFELAEQTVALPLFVSKFASIQKEILQRAISKQLIKDGIHKLKKSTNSVTEYPIGSYVLALYPETRMGRLPPTKLHTLWKGPMQIINSIGSKYTLRNLSTGKLEDYHISSLKAFIVDEDHINPVDIAQKDYRTWITERIIDHRPKKKLRELRRDQLEFLVKWEGYPDDQSTWEPWKNVRRNQHLIEYLQNHQMTSLIPLNLR